MPEHLRPYVSSVPGGGTSHGIECLPKIADHVLGCSTPRRWKEQAVPGSVTAEYVFPEYFLELRPERHRSMTVSRLEPSPVIRPEVDQLAIEADICNLEAKDLCLSATCQKESSQDRMEELRRESVYPFSLPPAGGFEQQSSLMDFQPLRFPSCWLGLLKKRLHRVMALRHMLFCDRSAEEM
jgi:hypothetical protein